MKFRSHLLAAFIAASLMPFAVVAADAVKPAKEPAKEKAEPKKAEAVSCTGSRIKSAKSTDCEKKSSQPLRSYTEDELRDTGEMDVAAALRQLNPSIR